MKNLIYILALLLPAQLFGIDANDLEELYVTKAKTFVNEYPLVENDIDELGLVDLWQRIKGLHNLVNVWDSNQAAFNRPGSNELRSWYIHKRIWSHQSRAVFYSDDKQVDALAALIRLHASFANRYMDGEIKYGPYAELANHAESYGHHLAVQVEKKYGKGKKVLKPEKSIGTWKRVN